MPTPDRTSLELIVSAARGILERSGADGLTMQAVADRVGVKAPSLYKRVRNRDALVGLVVEATLVELAVRLERARVSVSRDDVVAAVAREFRSFAHEFPVAYAVSVGPLPEGSRPARETLAATSAPIIDAAASVVGDQHALEAARTITAWANGFLGMELSGSFQLGGDVDAAFDYGVDILQRALAVSVSER